MKVFTSTSWEGMWPVGVAALVVAADEDAARQILVDELARRRLPQPEGEVIELSQVNMAESGVVILNDGNY